MSSHPAVRALLSTGQVWIRGRGGAARLEAAGWGLADLAGRFVELTGDAALTAAIGLCADAQRAREPVAWITGTAATFFPPDVAASGIDLAALAVVRVGAGAAMLRAADQLLRSGAFGLVVVDAASARSFDVPLSVQSRLASLTKRHGSALVGVTEGQPGRRGFGAFVSLRAECTRHRLAPGRYRCRIAVVKDKRRGPGWHHEVECDGAAGMR